MKFATAHRNQRRGTIYAIIEKMVESRDNPNKRGVPTARLYGPFIPFKYDTPSNVPFTPPEKANSQPTNGYR
jgi:hypothetical protein